MHSPLYHLRRQACPSCPRYLKQFRYLLLFEFCSFSKFSDYLIFSDFRLPIFLFLHRQSVFLEPKVMYAKFGAVVQRGPTFQLPDTQTYRHKGRFSLHRIFCKINFKLLHDMMRAMMVQNGRSRTQKIFPAGHFVTYGTVQATGNRRT